MKHTKIALFVLAVCAIAFANACKKDPDPVVTPTGTLMFHIHTYIDSAEVDAGAVRPDADGRHFQLDEAKLLISGIKLKKSDGTYQAVDNVYVLKTIEKEEYTIGAVPAGNYVGVSFNIGVDATANAKAPTSFTSPNPLADATNWFGSTSQGYIFANVQGKADVSAGQTGPVDQSFSYQLGSSAMLKTVTLPDKAFSVVANQEAIVHLLADYGLMLKGIDFKTQSVGSPLTNSAVAQKVADNVPNIFRYEE
ncbi:MAG: MbnP family protein [Bacteroidota bacterium]